MPNLPPETQSEPPETRRSRLVRGLRLLMVAAGGAAALAVVAAVLAARTPAALVLIPGTPLLEPAALTVLGRYDGAAELLVPVRESRVVFMEEFAAIRRLQAFHPLMLRTRLFRVGLPDGSEGWVSEELRQDEATGELLPVCVPSQAVQLSFAAALCALLALLAGWGTAAWGHGPATAGTSGNGKLWAAVRPLALIVLVRWVLLLAAMAVAGGMLIRPTDEHGYFQVAHDLVNGRLSAPWSYTLGYPLFYLPLQGLFGADSVYDIYLPAALLNGFLVTPVAGCLVLLIVRRLTGSGTRALLVSLAWAVLPFLYFPVEFHAGGAGKPFLFKALFTLPDVNAGSYHLYYMYTAAGFHALSDAWSMLLVLLCLYLALQAGRGRNWLVLLGGLYGYACLVRINNIFFAPLLAYLLWHAYRDAWRGRLGPLLADAGAAAGAAAAVFSLQLVVNRLQFGSVFTFPYALHASGAARGFAVDMLSTGMPLLLGCNFLYVCLAAGALFFIRDTRLRVTLTLWIVPLLFFFCGYVVAGASPVRFILPLYPALLAAWVCADAWDESHGCAHTWLILLCLGAVFISVAAPAAWTPPFPFLAERCGWSGAAKVLAAAMPLAGAAVLSLLTGGRLLMLAFLTLVLFCAGQPWLVAVVLLWHLGVAVLRWGTEFAKGFRAGPAPCPPG